MSATTEVDQMLRRTMRLLHSSQANSATELREMLDQIIKQRYGPEKMLCNTLSKKHLEEETNFPGRMTTPAPAPAPHHQQPSTTDDIINLTHSPTKTISDDSPDTRDDGNLKEFGDLNCCVCGEMVFTATNRLIECSKCGTLYHQECHKPPITDAEASEDQEHNWQCDSCFNKPSTSKAAGIAVTPYEPIPLVSKTKSSATSSRSSSSSNSSSPFYKQEPAATSLSKHHNKSSSSSSSKSHKEDRSSSSSKGGAVTPSINVISAGEKSSSHSSKKPSSHSSSSKSSSSKSSSKHHESNSSKRKSSKC